MKKRLIKWLQKRSGIKIPAHKDESAFTLIEMLVVIAIVGMLMSVVGVQIFSRFEKAKVETTKLNMRQLGQILAQFRLDCGRYPSADEGLEALIEAPAGLDCKGYDPNGYVKSTIPKDGWNTEYFYESEGRQYELISYGADGKEGGEGYDGDISSKDLD